MQNLITTTQGPSIQFRYDIGGLNFILFGSDGNQFGDDML